MVTKIVLTKFPKVLHAHETSYLRIQQFKTFLQTSYPNLSHPLIYTQSSGYCKLRWTKSRWKDKEDNYLDITKYSHIVIRHKAQCKRDTEHLQQHAIKKTILSASKVTSSLFLSKMTAKLDRKILLYNKTRTEHKSPTNNGNINPQ